MRATRGARRKNTGTKGGHRLLTMSHRSRGQANGGGHSKGNSDVAKVSARAVPRYPCATTPAPLPFPRDPCVLYRRLQSCPRGDGRSVYHLPWAGRDQHVSKIRHVFSAPPPSPLASRARVAARRRALSLDPGARGTPRAVPLLQSTQRWEGSVLAIRRNPKLFGMTLEIEKESAKKRNNLEIKGPMALSLLLLEARCPCPHPHPSLSQRTDVCPPPPGPHPNHRLFYSHVRNHPHPVLVLAVPRCLPCEPLGLRTAGDGEENGR